MAYLRKLDVACQYCQDRRAVVELLNRRNAVVGRYCQRCGRRALRELLNFEATR